ncbi:NUDIX domain-containing protein [bacterium]|nr:NUDIX domain-containing protein [bacterium]
MTTLSNIPIRKRAVVGVILRGNCFLTIRRSQTVAAPGKICFPGGGIESGETEPAALVREILEELGVAATANERLFETVTHWGTSVAWWHATIAADAQLALNEEEVAESFWHRPEHLLSERDLLSSNREFLQAWRSGVFAIPGITAPGDRDEISG